MDVSISALLRAYRDDGVTPAEVIAQVRAVAQAHAQLQAWIYRLSDAELAPYLARLAGHSPDTLPLYGIPFAIKDNIDLAGVPTTAACPAFAYTPERSAFVVQRLIDAGAIPLGKTNLDQFATGLVGTRSPYGVCRNPFDNAYIAGGSSSGSAVAVATGMASFSLGTDTAGSGRVPAAFNNLIGVKPTRGLIGTSGVVPACRSLDCVSVFALTTDDAERVLAQAIAADPDDAYARVNTFDNSGRQYGRAEGGFRFGVPRADQLEFFGDSSAARLFEAAVARMQVVGGEPVEIDFAPFLAAARLLYEGPWVAERYIATEAVITGQPEAMLPVIREIVGGAQGRTAMDVFRAQYALQQHRRAADAVLTEIDFLLTPTAPTIYRIEAVERDPIALNSRLGYYTNYMNLLDCAAVAVPAGFLDNKLPWGVSLVARAGEDRKLLSFANRWQQTLGLALGVTQQPLPPGNATAIRFAVCIPVVVCGAHLEGLPLNWQLRERGARLAQATATAAAYRLYALPGGPPYRPALVRDETEGRAIEVEVWDVPATEFGSFVAGIPAPLGIGKVELADGSWQSGFICEPRALQGAREISAFGGWRNYLA